MKVGLVGCVKTKLTHSAPARDLYISPLFRARRDWVAGSCDSWFILSAKHGLTPPDEFLEPYDVTLNDLPTDARRRWSVGVLQSLRRELGSIADHAFEIHAGHAYYGSGLVDGLRRAGATVAIPTAGLALGEQLAFYSRRGGVAAVRAPAPTIEDLPRGPQPTRTLLKPPGGKYELLAARVCAGPWPLTLTISEIDAMVGDLPRSAFVHRAWWANDPSHSHARAWLSCGRTVASVDLNARRVTFR